MARMRIFLALPLDKPVRDRILSLQENLARTGAEVKWTEPENLHVTLLFLGEVDDRAVIDVCRAAGVVCREHAPFSMEVEKTGCFPNARRPRVLWVGIGAGAEEVTALHDALEAPLLELGCYRREERQYTPHLTLGRVKTEPVNQELLTAFARQANWRGGSLQVGEVHVMSSELRSQGPVYTVLSRIRLGG